MFPDNRIARAAQALLLTAAFALPLAPALADDAAQPAAGDATKTMPKQRHGGIDAYLTKLHGELKITPAQEAQWAAVAQVMRDNAAAMSAMFKERRAKSAGMNAVDDLKSYGAFTEAQAEGSRKLVPAFEALYNSFSDDQKKAADALFRHVRKPPKAPK